MGVATDAGSPGGDFAPPPLPTREDEGTKTSRNGQQKSIIFAIMPDHVPENIVNQFDAAMDHLPQRMRDEIHHPASGLERGIRSKGCFGFARRVLQPGDVTEGYTACRSAGRLDLTIEALALKKAWRDHLFDPPEIALAHARLEMDNAAEWILEGRDGPAE